MAPAGARPVLRHADPARAVFVVPAQPVPRKLHLDAAVFVAIDFFVGRADHGGDLRAVDHGLAAGRGLPVDLVGHDVGGVAVARAMFRARAVFFLAGVLYAVMPHAHRAPALVPIFARVAGQVEGHAGNQAGVVTLHLRHARVAAQAQQAALCEGLAGLVALVAAGIVIAFVAAVLMLQVAGNVRVFLVVLRVGVGVVALGLARGAQLLGVGEAAQRGLSRVAAG
ncbi:hypothetical protein D3C86_1501320 [compost metagenome]